MSGPKVVRVVTREELEAIGRRQIAAVDAAIAHVRRTLRRFDLEEKALEAALASRRQQLEALLDRGLFRDLQRQAEAQVDYFMGEATRLEGKAMAAIEVAKSRRRRVSDAARSLIAALETSGKAPHAELRDVVSRALGASDEALDACQRVLDQALKVLSNDGVVTGGVTEGQAKLARRLGVGTVATSLAEWLAGQPATADAQTMRLDQVLAEFELRSDASSIEAFGRRAAAIAAEASSSQRRLLTDSLILDARAALDRLKAAEALRRDLHELQGALGAYSTAEARDAARMIATALAGPDASLDASLATVARATIEEAQRQLAATARRRAVLAGLATLGYEVREAMATAWARDGRLVIRKPGVTDYGVELAAPADAARLQVRLVGAQTPMQPRSAARDHDHEATWCSEFGTLQTLLAERGGDLQIERAAGVGTQPIKTIAFEGVIDDATDAQARGLVSRSR
jgi:hypothetical protein